MFRIAVCDDDKELCNTIENVIMNQRIIDSEISTEVFYDGKSLYDYIIKNDKFDLIFLDIEMECMNGIETGHALRDILKDDDVQIVYISSNSSYAMELFAVRPVDFLIKPVEDRIIEETLLKAVNLSNKRNIMYEYQDNHNQACVSMGRILYFEVRNRQINIHTKDSIITHYGRMSDVVKKVNSNKFILINRSVLVNYDAISEYRIDKIRLLNSEEIQISRGRQKEVQKIMVGYMG